MTPATLVIGGDAGCREAAIAAVLDSTLPTVVLLEGLPDGRSVLNAGRDLQIIRIAAGCPCCTGNLTLQVTLNRILRRPPSQLYISLAGTRHLEQIRHFLSQPPYQDLLRWNQELRV